MDPVAPTSTPPAPAAHAHEADVPGLVQRTADLLRDGVPLTLLLDLAEDSDPRSAQRYVAEGGDSSWVHRER